MTVGLAPPDPADPAAQRLGALVAARPSHRQRELRGESLLQRLPQRSGPTRGAWTPFIVSHILARKGEGAPPHHSLHCYYGLPIIHRIVLYVYPRQKQMATTQTNVKDTRRLRLVSCWPPRARGTASRGARGGVHRRSDGHSRSHEETDARARMRSLAATSLSLRSFTSSASAAYATAALCAPP